ncbi:MAG: hypothetical protein AAGD25_14445 [Cyanobacteria bacterium P01_F01_bin.150]
MDEEKLFKALKRKTKPILLDLLEAAYHKMDTDQRHYVFADVFKEMRPKTISAQKTLEQVEKFYQDSLDEKYYAPFNVNSKNFSHIPAKTSQWFRKLNDLLSRSTEVVNRDENTLATQCFSKLYELILKIDNGDEGIVFADELGSWMIPGDENVYIQAYLTASAKTATPKEYAEIALPLIKRDSYSSFCNQVYAKATKTGDEEQVTYLEKQLKEKSVKKKRR